MKKFYSFLPWIALGIAGYVLYKKYMPSLVALPSRAGQAISSGVIGMLQPRGIYNTAGEESDAYTVAVNKIIAANPQYMPILVKKFLISIAWKLGDPLPAYINRPNL